MLAHAKSETKAWRIPAAVLLVGILSGCGGEEGGQKSFTDGFAAASEYFLGFAGGFVYDDGGTGIELRSISDFETIASLSTAVTEARNAQTFMVQQFSRWQDIFGLGAFPANSNWPFAAINLEHARGAGLTGAGQTIAIYDGGFRFSHEELSEGDRSVTDLNSAAIDDHGTAVASIAAGSDDFGLMEGVAPNANLRLFGWSSIGGASVNWEDSVQDAAANGVIAHNNSWALSAGGNRLGIASNDLSLFDLAFPEVGFLTDLTNFTSESVVVFAADNDETRTDSSFMAALPVLLPELERGWLKVINLFVPYDVGSDNFGSPVRLSAACLEAARWCLGADGSMFVANAADDTGYSIGTGASYAAPQVSGALALLAEAFPTLGSEELRNRLLASADNSFFAHTDELVFEGGYRHGYNAEFGHGLMDLRAALLPIGTLSTSSADGTHLIAGDASVVGGGASGDALVQGLSDISVLSTDSLRSDFRISASSFAATSTATHPLMLDAARTAYADLNDERNAERMRTGTGADRYSEDPQALFAGLGETGMLTDHGGAQLRMFTKNNTRISVLLPRDSEGAVGLEAAYATHIGRNTLKIGLSTMRDPEAVLGIRSAGAGDEISSISAEMDLALSIPLDQRSAFGISGQYGIASATGAGLITDFGQIDFSSFEASYGYSDIFRAGDNLRLVLQRPVKVVGGSAEVEVASGRTALDELEYSTHRINLKPSSNQFDIGFDFRSPIFESTELHLGVRHSFNFGHIAGEQSTSALLRLRWTF